MVYIGSCIVTLKQRLGKHKRKGNLTASKQIIDCGDYDIYLIEKYPCNNDLELRMREQMYIDIYKNDGKNVINGKNAYTSIEDKKEYMKEYNKQDYQNNIEDKKENNNERAKQWYENNKGNLKEYRKEYYKNNKQYIKQYKKEYRKNNKEKQAEHNLFRSKRVVDGFYNFIMMLNEY
jgi:lipopolysaccharide export LptBFGC system permease protein LptF